MSKTPCRRCCGDDHRTLNTDRASVQAWERDMAGGELLLRGGASAGSKDEQGLTTGRGEEGLSRQGNSLCKDREE